MDKNYEIALNGSLQEATEAKDDISHVFQSLNSICELEGRRRRLIFANTILRAIYHCQGLHDDLYTEIITKVFGTNLHPEADGKLWTTYLDMIRFYYYNLMCRKNYKATAAIFKTIDAYENKVQNENVASIILNTYSYHLFLQISQQKRNAEQGHKEAIRAIDAMILIFNEILDRNMNLNMQFNNLLQLSMNWLLPNSNQAKCSKFYTTLPKSKVIDLFSALFNCNSFQRLSSLTSNEIMKYIQAVISELNNLLQFDIINKLQLRLCLHLVQACTQDNRLKRSSLVAKFFHILYQYLDCLYITECRLEFTENLVRATEKFIEYFKQHSTDITSEIWFSDVVIFFCYLHSNLLNTNIFDGFWRQMCQPVSFKAICDLFAVILKLCPYVHNDSKLIALDCCSSSRKHIIVMFTQTVLGVYMLYCRNINEECEQLNTAQSAEADPKQQVGPVDAVSGTVSAILSYAFAVVEKMDCITETSQGMNILTTRFKQITLNVKTVTQATFCITICSHFKKLKEKITHSEWSILLRRLYKCISVLNTANMELIKELQMCYIASLLDQPTKLEIPFIRLQINMYYVRSSDQEERYNKCLSQQYKESRHSLKVALTAARRNLLFYLDMQDLIKYDRNSNMLMQSLLAAAPTQYAYLTALRIIKLQPEAVKQLQTLQKAMCTKIKKEGTNRRLDQLIYGHACTLVLQHQQDVINQKFQIDSKDLMENNLEQLFARKELTTLSLQNELEQVKLAVEAFKAFEKFFQTFDEEIISSDEAIICWEYIIDDLASLAQYFQFAGYVNNCLNAWHLHYKIARFLQDDNSSMRSLTFFCEYYDVIDQKAFFNNSLNEEINIHLPTIVADLNNLTSLSKQGQTYLLMAISQIAYYYASCSRYVFAQMLLQFVEQTRDSLPGRHGKYDIINGTVDAIKFRLLWRHYDNKSNIVERSEAENHLMHQCILRHIDENIDNFRDFSYISSKDSILYMILIMNLTREIAECSVNRLCGNFINALFVAVSKIALQSGLALRFTQSMMTWMCINLQQEFVEKAQTKLKLIELILGVRSLKDLQAESNSNVAGDNSKEVTLSLVNPMMESVRKIPHVELSPIRTGTLTLSPNLKQPNLLDYLKYNVETKFLPECEILEWTYFAVGCLIARLYFLVEHHQQLDEFYECSSKWLNTRRNKFYMKYFKNVQLIYLQHYANYLRSRQKYNKARKCLEYAIEYNGKIPTNVDLVYNINLHLQLHSAIAEMEIQNHGTLPKSNGMCHQLDALEYRKIKKAMREESLQQITSVTKTSKNKGAPNGNVFLTPTPKNLHCPQVINSAAGKLESCSQNSTRKVKKPKLKWELCQEMKNLKTITPSAYKTADSLQISDKSSVTQGSSLEDVLNENMGKLNLEDLNEIINENTPSLNDKPKRQERRTPSVRKLKAPIIILDDSPNNENATVITKIQPRTIANSKPNETPNQSNDKTPANRSPILTRSQRRAAKDNNLNNAENLLSRKLLPLTTPISSRRRPKV